MDRIGLGKIFGTTPATGQLNGAGSPVLSDKSEWPSPFADEHDEEKSNAMSERKQELGGTLGDSYLAPWFQDRSLRRRRPPLRP
jgi:hypothetical protein